MLRTCLIVLSTAFPILAQFSAGIQGVVKDASGAAVTVTGDVPGLQTENAAISRSITDEEVLRLPQFNATPFSFDSNATKIDQPTFGLADGWLSGRVIELQVRLSF